MTSAESSRLNVIESKVDTILVKLDYIEAAGNDHETRMRSLEKWTLSLTISGLIAAGAVIASAIVR